MEPILEIIGHLGPNYDARITEIGEGRGLYVSGPKECCWINKATFEGSFGLFMRNVEEKRTIDQAFLPAFTRFNFMEDSVDWIISLYPSLGRRYPRQLFFAAAILYEEAIVRLKDDVTTRLAKEIYNVAVEFDQMGPGISPIDDTILKQILKPSVPLDSNLPWRERHTYRRIGIRSVIQGVEIDLSERQDANGHEICDFQDVFVALADIMDFMYCPVPLMILNRSGTSYLEREDRDLMVGRIGPIEMEVQSLLELRISNDVRESDYRGDDTQKYFEKVIDAICAHGIVTDREKSVRYRRKTFIYFDSEMLMEPIDLYVTSMLEPCTLLRHFYYNEMEHIALNKKHDCFYYSDGKGFAVRIHLDRLVPKEGAMTVNLTRSRKRHSYSLWIETTTLEQLTTFEKQFERLVCTMKTREADVQRFRVSGERGAIPMVPPELGQNTRQHTSKRQDVNLRAVPPDNRPIYISPRYLDEPNFALKIAKNLAMKYHGNEDAIYVSRNLTIVRLPSGISAEDCIENTDSFTAYYIALEHGQQVINFSEDGIDVRPGMVSEDRKPGNYLCSNYSFKGLPEKYEWSTRPLYVGETDYCDLISAVEIARQETYSRGYWKTKLASREHFESLAPLAKPELFDLTCEEILDDIVFGALGRPVLDSSLHYRMLEEVYGCTILTVINADKPHAKLTSTSQLVLESSRRSGHLIRDIQDRPLVLILKYYHKGWKYAPINHSPKIGDDVFLRSLERMRAAEAHLIRDPALRSELVFTLMRNEFQLFDTVTRSVSSAIIDRTIHTIIRHCGLENIVSQTVNANGYTTSICLYVPTHRLCGAIMEIAKNAIPAASPIAEASPVKCTIDLKNPIAPLRVPISDVFFPLRPNSVIRDLLSAFPSAPSGTDVLYFIGEEKQVNTHRIRILVEANTPAPVVSSNTMGYLNQMTVLLSLFHSSFLRSEEYVKYLESGTARSPASIAKAVRRTIDEFYSGSRTGALVAVHHRFLLGIPLECKNVESALKFFLPRYFKEFMPLTPETANHLEKYFECEIKWILAWCPPAGAVRYVDGIHTCVPTENLHPSASDLRRFFPAATGKCTIVRSWKEYEYSVIRCRAREKMSSCTSYIDLSDSTAAATEKNKTAFVKRLPGGAVAYATAVADQDDARHQLERAGENGDAPVIKGLVNFKRAHFKKNASVIYCTSTNADQGSWYLMRIFVDSPVFAS